MPSPPFPFVQGPLTGSPAVTQTAQLAPQAARPHLLKKLVRRITFAATPAEYALAQQLGYEGFLEYQLNPGNMNDAAMDAKLASYWYYGKTSGQLWAGSDVTTISELQDATVARAVLSHRQLFEQMVGFWTDHFNIFAGKPQVWNLLPPDRENVIRKYALATFPELLQASVKSPAMLHYLDNQLSVGGNPNQNFARELMELHALGVDNGYTQTDVKEAARCFTGWGYHNFGSNPTSGTFLFNPAIHDQGAKTVLGTQIPAGGGVNDGLAVIQILASHPNTAGFIAKKLCRWLLGENVRDVIIDLVKNVYLSTGGDIKAMIRAALRRNHLNEAELKLKRPFHLFSGFLRTTNAQLSGNYGSHRLLRYAAAGHLPHNFITPNGPPDTTAAWAGSMLPRWNFGGELLQGIIWDTTVNTGAFFAGAGTAAQCVEIINDRLFLGDLGPVEIQKLTDFLAVNPGNSTRRAETLALAFSSPRNQYF